MAALDYEAEYNNRKRVPEYPEFAARWAAASAAYRSKARAELDLPYGSGERQRYDLFLASDATAPLAVFIHGGYWQRGDRKDYSFVAEKLNAAGIDVAVPSYSLCPAVSVVDIVGEMRQCLAALWRQTRKYPAVTGNSAGGHLTGAMVGTDWSKVTGVPADLVRGGVAISGVFDLAPLLGTSINDLAHMDAGAARAASPLLWPPPPKGRRLVAAVGGVESSEFLRQSKAIADAWASAGLETEYLEVPGTNHFSVLDELTKPGSTLFMAVAGLAHRVNRTS